MFIQRLSHHAHQRWRGIVLIGDMEMPAGVTADTPIIRLGLMWIFSCSCRKRAGYGCSYCTRKHWIWSPATVNMLFRRAGRRVSPVSNWRWKIMMSPTCSSTRPLNNSFSSMLEGIETGSRVRPWFQIARICTCVYAALPTACGAKINPYTLRWAMDAALSCKAGSNRQKLAPPSLRRRYLRRCRLPTRFYWTSMYSDG